MRAILLSAFLATAVLFITPIDGYRHVPVRRSSGGGVAPKEIVSAVTKDGKDVSNETAAVNSHTETNSNETRRNTPTTSAPRERKPEDWVVTKAGGSSRSTPGPKYLPTSSPRTTPRDNVADVATTTTIYPSRTDFRRTSSRKIRRDGKFTSTQRRGIKRRRTSKYHKAIQTTTATEQNVTDTPELLTSTSISTSTTHSRQRKVQQKVVVVTPETSDNSSATVHEERRPIISQTDIKNLTLIAVQQYFPAAANKSGLGDQESGKQKVPASFWNHVREEISRTAENSTKPADDKERGSGETLLSDNSELKVLLAKEIHDTAGRSQRSRHISKSVTVSNGEALKNSSAEDSSDTAKTIPTSTAAVEVHTASRSTPGPRYLPTKTPNLISATYKNSVLQGTLRGSRSTVDLSSERDRDEEYIQQKTADSKSSPKNGTSVAAADTLTPSPSSTPRSSHGSGHTEGRSHDGTCRRHGHQTNNKDDHERTIKVVEPDHKTDQKAED